MYLPDPEHFILAADPGECDRVPRAVRQREPDSDRWPGDRRNNGEHAGGGGILQGDGRETFIQEKLKKKSLLPDFKYCVTINKKFYVCPAIIWKNEEDSFTLLIREGSNAENMH